MKISNENIVKNIAYLLALSSIILVSLATIFWFIKVLFLVYVIPFLAGIFLLVKILKLKYIDFDVSGEVLCIKTFNLLKISNQSSFSDNVEFPKQMLKDFNIQKKCCMSRIILTLERPHQNKKDILIYIPHTFLKNQQRENLYSQLHQIKKVI